MGRQLRSFRDNNPNLDRGATTSSTCLTSDSSVLYGERSTLTKYLCSRASLLAACSTPQAQPSMSPPPAPAVRPPPSVGSSLRASRIISRPRRLHSCQDGRAHSVSRVHQCRASVNTLERGTQATLPAVPPRSSENLHPTSGRLATCDYYDEHDTLNS